DTDELLPQGKPGQGKSSKKQTGTKQPRQNQPVPYASEYSSHVDIAADPVMPYLSADALRKLIDKRRVEMVEAAKQMNFIEAAQMRDEIIAMEDRLAKMNTEE
ncbi:MAG: excinuclease ABC subunit B, partial [Duncaniella sp.]|nr:excinuclease ABC subunit B [Duncaniella sp.]